MLSLESLARLSPPLVWVLGACIAGMIGYAVFYVPVRGELRVAGNELERALAIQANAGAEVEKERALAEVLDREEKALADEVMRTPGADGPAPDLLFRLPELARQSGVTIERWQPQAEEAIAAWGIRRPVKIQARASWASFLELLRRVTELPETVSIDDLSLVRSGDDDAPLEISFRASAVWVRPDLAEQAAREPDRKATL